MDHTVKGEYGVHVVLTDHDGENHKKYSAAPSASVDPCPHTNKGG